MMMIWETNRLRRTIGVILWGSVSCLEIPELTAATIHSSSQTRYAMSVKAATDQISSMTLNAGSLSPLKSPVPTQLVKELLRKNDEEHDIYFGKNHFHNHFPHTLLSQFA